MASDAPSLRLLLCPLLGVVFAAACHMAVARRSRRRSEWGHLLLGVAVGAVCACGATTAVFLSESGGAGLAPALLLNILNYLGIAYAYADFHNANLTALQLRILRECGASPNGLNAGALHRRYNLVSLLEHRLQKYVALGFLIRQGDVFRVGHPVLLWVSRFYRLLYRLVFGQPMPGVNVKTGTNGDPSGTPGGNGR